MPVTLKELGIGSEHFDRMAEQCTHFGKRTISGLMELDKKEILDIYRLALG